jgi:hypothetical protein
VLNHRLERRILPVQNKLINPLVAWLIARGLEPPTYAVLETVGRRTGGCAASRSPTAWTATRSG